MAKDGSIGPNGRSVRCARCDAVWYVEGLDPDALALQDNKTEFLTPETPIKPHSQIESNVQTELPLEPTKQSAASVGAHTLLRNKADAAKLMKRNKLIRLIWGIPLISLLALAFLVVAKRQTIVENHPKAASLFQTVGLNVKANGLDIQNLTSEPLIVDGDAILRVTGEVVNLTSQAKTAPLVQLRLENRSGEVLADWFVEPGSIPAKSRVKIDTDYPAPPIDGTELRYRFMPDE